MKNNRLLISLLTTIALLILCFPYLAKASNPTTQQAMIIYRNSVGEKQVLTAAKHVDQNYHHLQTIAGTFNKADIRRLKKSSSIVKVETMKKDTHLFTMAEKKQGSEVPSALNWNMSLIHASNAWTNGLSGKSVKVALIDTGVTSKVNWPNVYRYSFVQDVRSTLIDESSPYDNDGHGTFIAGILLGNVRNSLLGVAPDMSLYSLKVFKPDGAPIQAILKALDWSIAHKIDIVNLSLGMKMDDAILRNAIAKTSKAGIILVAAAGNDGNGKNVEYPARYSQVIAVSSIDKQSLISPFSNTGTQIEFAAPGNSVYSTDLQGNRRLGSGTSFATPHVTGFLALLKQQYPRATSSQLRKALRDYTIDLGVKGKDPFYGYGLIDFSHPLPNDVQDIQISNITSSSAVAVIKAPKSLKSQSGNYRIYLNGSYVKTINADRYKITNLKKKTTYKVEIKTRGNDGRLSPGVEKTFHTQS